MQADINVQKQLWPGIIGGKVGGGAKVVVVVGIVGGGSGGKVKGGKVAGGCTENCYLP